jgi:hypothetical protein
MWYAATVIGSLGTQETSIAIREECSLDQIWGLNKIIRWGDVACCFIRRFIHKVMFEFISMKIKINYSKLIIHSIIILKSNFF